ncbi:hypothetical protein DL769_002836 [Monosporascus sp. CRB-8-3]|nr:hypothetical protein DL769_002836 [Monosporascus sp. CRB-8-3]
MASVAGHKGVPLDEILQLHQNIHLLGPGIRECLICCTNDDVMAALLDGLARLCLLYEAARIKYSEANMSADGPCDARVQIHPANGAAHPVQQGHPTAPADKTSAGASRHHVHPTPRPAPNAMPSVALWRIELTDSETNLVAVTLIKQGLSQTGAHLRDLQQHLAKCLMARKMKSSNYDIYKKRVDGILNGIYSSLACI